MSETKLATKDQSIKSLITSPQYREQFASALPRHLSVDRFVRTLQTALLRNPDLANADKPSFFLAALNLSALGLEADGRRAHLIPFNNTKKGVTEVQLIIDYKGLAELVRRSGEVADLHADVVYEGDHFSFEYGTNQHLTHKPCLKGRGEVIAAYSFAKLKDGAPSFEVLSLDDVLDVRDGSQGYRRAKEKGYDHPWTNHFSEMAKKTAFRRHSKWLPLSPELREKIEIDDEDIPKEINVTPTEAIKPDFTPKEEPIQKAMEADGELVLEGSPLTAKEKLHIQLKEYGMTEPDAVLLASKNKKAPSVAKSFSEMTDSNIEWLESNFVKLVEGK